MAEQPAQQIKKRKRLLKIAKKLPKVQVGTIFNVFWTNGSYEKPSNPLTREEIDKNFIEVGVKIDFGENDTGTVTLRGKFNYLIYKGAEYFFLTPIRPIDIKKQEFVYSVVRDVSMTILCTPKLRMVGTLVKTTHESTLLDNLESTKPLIEDYDERVVIPLSKIQDTDPTEGRSYNSYKVENFKRIKAFSTRKLAWILGHLTDGDARDYILKYREEKKGTKLLFNCEYDYFLPYRSIIEHVRKWLSSGEVILGKMKNKSSGFDSYSSRTKFKSLYSNWNAVYVLSEVKSSLETIQHKYLLEVTEEKAVDIDDNFFEDINEITPLDPETLQPLVLNNRHIFDIMEDDSFTEDTTNFGGYYELLPRAYTECEDFSKFNKGVVSKSPSYNISQDELEKVGHLTDTKQDEVDGQSIINNIKINYYPDWWNNYSWSDDALKKLPDSVLNSNPVVGFILYEIYDYWSLTRKSDIRHRFYNMYNGGDTGNDILGEVYLTTGLRFYDPTNDLFKLDLLVSYDEDRLSLIKSDVKDINYGFVTSIESKQLKNALEVFLMYSFIYENDSLGFICKDFAKHFKCSFIAHAKTSDYEVTNLKTSTKEFDLTKESITGDSDVMGVKNFDLVEHCWSNYVKVREKSTILDVFTLPRPLVKGDLFWSNVSWCFCHNLNKKILDINTPRFAFLICPKGDLSGVFEYRISKLTPIDGKVGLSKVDNIISSDESFFDIYPWLVYEKKYVLKAYAEELQTVREDTYNERKNNLKRLLVQYVNAVQKFIDIKDGKDLKNKILGTLGAIGTGLAVGSGVATTIVAPVIVSTGTSIAAAGVFASIYGTASIKASAAVFAGSAAVYSAAPAAASAAAIPVVGAIVALAAVIAIIVLSVPHPYVRKHPWWLDGYWDGTTSLGHTNFLNYMNNYIDNNYKKPGKIMPKNYMWQFYYKPEDYYIAESIVVNRYKSYMGYTPYLPAFCFEDESTNVIGSTWITSVDTSLYGYEVFVKGFSIGVNAIFEEWRRLEDFFSHKLYRTLSFSDENIYENLSYQFAPTKQAESVFEKTIGNKGHKIWFTQKGTNIKVYGKLSLTLYDIFENMHLVSATKNKLDCYWTDVTLEDIKKPMADGSIDKTKLHVFALKRDNQGKRNIKAYLIMQWDKDDEKFLTQIIINDEFAVTPTKINIKIPEEKIKNSNLYQCINQKNYLYVLGHKIPIKAKLMQPFVKDPFEIYIDTLTNLTTIDKYKVNVKTSCEIIDTKISVPKRVVELGKEVINYVDLERLRLDISEREASKSLSIAAGEEKARILREKLQNAKDELAFQQVMGPLNLIGNVLMGAARVTRFTVPYPENQFQKQSNVAAMTLAGASGWQLGTGISQHIHNMSTGQRDIEQMDKANSFTIGHEKNMLEHRHKYDEMREKAKMLELTSNYSDSSPGEDDIELKTYNKLLFGNEKIDFGFIHYRPAENGKLMQYIKSYYSRYGVDLFVSDFVLDSEKYVNSFFVIWQFDSITSINIINHEFSEKIRKIFINGVKFIFTEYKFDDPKLTLDESYIIKAEFDEKRKIDETRRVLLAKGEIDAELGEQVRIAKEHLDQANAEFQKIEKQKETLEARVAELEGLMVGGCTRETLEELAKCKEDLEKHKNSASFISEQKMALEEQITSLNNQLALEKRKVKSGDEQVKNAGRANLKLVERVAALEAANKEALASKALAEEIREQVIKERDECNAAAELVRQELQTEKAELAAKTKELQDCKDEKERIVCVDGWDEHAVFNDYVDRIESLIIQMSDTWYNGIYDEYRYNQDRYTYIEYKDKTSGNSSYNYSPDLNISVVPSGSYISLKSGGYILHQEYSWYVIHGAILLYKDNVINGTYGYRYDNIKYHPPWCLLRHGALLSNGNYKGFWVRYFYIDEVSTNPIEQRRDTNFLSSTKGHELTYRWGIFLAVHKEYIKLCKQFKQWNAKTDYLNKNNIPVVENSNWSQLKTSGGKVKFYKAVYFNTNHIGA